MRPFAFLFALVLATVPACSCERVSPGHAGIVVHMVGDEKGVGDEAVGVGWQVIGWTSQLYTFPTFSQNYTWDAAKTAQSPADESITFQTKEGMSVNADVGITFHIPIDSVPLVFKTYRRGIDEITHTFLRNHVRDAFNEIGSTLPVESVYGGGKAELLKAVKDQVVAKLSPIGINVDEIYFAGPLHLPEQVTNALNAKVQATQMAQQRENELRQAEAEAKKVVAEAEGRARSVLVEAESQAKANEILSKSITPTLVQYEQIKKWDGRLPTVSGTGAGVLLDLKGAP